MPEPSPPSALMQFVPLLVLSVVWGAVAMMLAREKGRNVTKWAILGIIPIVNLFAAGFMVGATNLRHERKLDAILKGQGQDPTAFK